MNKLEAEISKLIRNDGRLDPVSVSFELQGKEAYVYRFVHTVWTTTLDDYDKTTVDKDLFLIGLDRVEKKMREQLIDEEETNST